MAIAVVVPNNNPIPNIAKVNQGSTSTVYFLWGGGGDSSWSPEKMISEPIFSNIHLVGFSPITVPFLLSMNSSKRAFVFLLNLCPFEE